jgi:hypothetical protein
MGRDITRRLVLQSLLQGPALCGSALALGGCEGGLYASGRAAPAGRILVMPVHVTLGERRLGGEFRLRRDWSEAVRRPVLDAAVAVLATRNRIPVFLDDQSDLEAAWSLARLHRPVAESLMGFDRPLTGRTPVATRGLPGLGPAGQNLVTDHDARTGLFVSVTGEYAEGYQRAAEIVIGEIFDVELSGLERRIVISLVSLETGAVVWSGARHDRAIRDPRRAARHARELARIANLTGVERS